MSAAGGMPLSSTDAVPLRYAQVLDELPDLEPDDISACLHFASRRLDHPIVAA